MFYGWCQRRVEPSLGLDVSTMPPVPLIRSIVREAELAQAASLFADARLLGLSEPGAAPNLAGGVGLTIAGHVLFDEGDRRGGVARDSSAHVEQEVTVNSD